MYNVYIEEYSVIGAPTEGGGGIMGTHHQGETTEGLFVLWCSWKKWYSTFYLNIWVLSEGAARPADGTQFGQD